MSTVTPRRVYEVYRRSWKRLQEAILSNKTSYGRNELKDLMNKIYQEECDKIYDANMDELEGK